MPKLVRLLQAIDKWLDPYINGDKHILSMTNRELLYARALATCGKL